MDRRERQDATQPSSGTKERPLEVLFVYNADGGLLGAVMDAIHKVLSPDTYPCRLCELTHSTFRMRARWKKFLKGLDARCEFMHRDQFRALQDAPDVRLPAVFARLRRDGPFEVLLDTEEIEACSSTEELESALLSRLGLRHGR